MKNACLDTLLEMARSNPELLVMGQDSTFPELLRELPSQHVHEGISEAHAMGMATGMALDGCIVYTFGTASFLTRRCFEQICLDAALHSAKVRIIGFASGLFYTHWGAAHTSMDDIALMRLIPGMAVLAPASATEVRELLPQTLSWPGPLYIRLGKSSARLPPYTVPSLGKGILLREGSDYLVITTGTLLRETLDAAELAAQNGIKAAVLHMPSIEPLDAELILRHLKDKRCVFVVEEHAARGGLGSAVLECLAGQKHPPVKILGPASAFITHAGSREEHLKNLGLDAFGLSRSIITVFRENHGQTSL